MKNLSIEPKSCPLCNGEAEVSYGNGSWGYFPSCASVFCKNCKLRGPSKSGKTDGDRSCIDEAVKAWNKRYIPKITDEDVERVALKLAGKPASYVWLNLDDAPRFHQMARAALTAFLEGK